MKTNTKILKIGYAKQLLLLFLMTLMTKNVQAANNKSFFTIERHRVWINVTDSSTGAFSQTLFGYRQGATDGYDPGLDGAYFGDGAIALTSLIGADRYTIQFKGLTYNANDLVPLSFMASYSGTFTFVLDHVDGFFLNSSQPIYILDTETNTYTNIKTGTYSFSSGIGIFNDRFKLTFYNPYVTSSLGTNDSVFTPNDLLIYQDQENIEIQSGEMMLKSLAIYNLNGQIIYQNHNVNDTKLVVTGLNLSKQAIIINAVNQEGILVSKKWLYLH